MTRSLANPEKFFDQVIEIDLSTLEPLIIGPHTPDLARPVSKVGADAQAQRLAARDVGRARSVRAPTRRTRTSRAPRRSLARPCAHGLEGQDAALDHARLRAGARDHRARRPARRLRSASAARVLANACGPCIGQWKRDDIDRGRRNTIVTSYNRNFPQRNDGQRPRTRSSRRPTPSMAMALAGTLDFDPATDTLTAPDGTQVKFAPPDRRRAAGAWLRSGRIRLPRAARTTARRHRRQRVADERSSAAARTVRAVGRQGLHRPSRPPQGQGQVHHRPHLDGRSVAQVPRPPRQHLGQPVPRRDQRVHRRGRQRARIQLDGETKSFPEIAKHYNEAGQRWVVIGDENMGEGSSREHAAMEPRFRGAKPSSSPAASPASTRPT